MRVADYGTAAGRGAAAVLLAQALSDGALGRSLALAAEALPKLLRTKGEPQAAAPAPEEAAALEAWARAEDEAGVTELRAAAVAFLAEEEEASEGAALRARLVMLLGASLLNAFVSANWTGPPLHDLPPSPLPRHAEARLPTRPSQPRPARRSAQMRRESEVRVQ
jgi:hypothetical protein